MKFKHAMGILVGSALAMNAAAKTDTAQLTKDLKIMSNILHTALKDNTSRDGIRYRSLEYKYLADQGVVFSLESNMAGRGLRIPAPPMPVAPAIPNIIINGDEVLDSDEFADLYSDAMEQAREALEQVREHMSELRDDQREINWELRDYERRKRDLEFESRHADKERSTEIKKELAQLDKELAELKRKQAEVEQRSAQIAKEQAKKAEEQQAEWQKQYKAYMGQFESTVTDVLCTYGAGLKSMDSAEHISFVLNNLGDVGSKNNQDLIYVFKNADVMACVGGKIKPQDLLSKSQHYAF